MKNGRPEKIIFRLAISGYFIFAMLFLSYFINYGHNFPEQASIYLSWLGTQSMSQFEILAEWIGTISLGLSAIAAVGLFLLYQWARPTFAISIVLLFISGLPAKYPLLMTAEQNFFDSVASLFAGLIIALAYWSPIKDNLKK